MKITLSVILLIMVGHLSVNAQTTDDVTQNINKVKPMVDSKGWPYDVLLDPNSDFCKALGIQMIPYTLIVDGAGKIVYKHNGYTDGAEQELIEKVRELVKK